MRNLEPSDINNFEYLTENQLAQPIKLHESWAGRRLMEALSHLPELSGSLDMRFQQRQQQEKEQRRIELSGSGGSSNETDLARNSLTTAKAANIGNGKVRQMFDERRRGAGIDRSNPLKPIKPISTSSKALSTPTLTTTPTQQNKIVHKVSGVRSQDQITDKAHTVSARKPSTGGGGGGMMTKQAATPNSLNSRGHSREQNNNAAYAHKDLDSLDGYGDSIVNDNNNNNNNNNGHSLKSPNIKLNPVQTKKSPPLRTAAAASTATRNAQQNGTAQSLKTENVLSSAPSNRSTAKSPMTSARTPDEAPKGPPAAGMVSCRICGRHFNEDRIAKHEQVCQKMANSKRKIFDASKHRIQGTEAESYHRRKPNSRAAAASTRSTPSYTSAAAVSEQKIQPKKSNWRQKHEEFIAAIRAAKQVQAHLARGGKLSDLPPPPPSENPDYVQCPHCGRRFNETAAERHIPKCATMLHNKPKPGAATNKRR